MFVNLSFFSNSRVFDTIMIEKCVYILLAAHTLNKLYLYKPTLIANILIFSVKNVQERSSN